MLTQNVVYDNTSYFFKTFSLNQLVNLLPFGTRISVVILSHEKLMLSEPSLWLKNIQYKFCRNLAYYQNSLQNEIQNRARIVFLS